MAIYVMATGGTGGHIFPAVATAKELEKRGHQTIILGQSNGMEEITTKKENLEFFGVSAGKFDRSNFNIKGLLDAGKGILEARRFLKTLNPKLVLGFGGFASLPGVLAAQSLGIDTVLHEQNAHLGLTQKVSLAKAKKIACAYKEVIGLENSKNKIEFVGMPIREITLTKKEAFEILKKDGIELKNDILTVFIMGGSQGSVFFNNNIPEIIKHTFKDKDKKIQAIHSVGSRWEQDMKHEEEDWYKITGFVNSSAAFTVSDFAITRAGTGTIAEAAFYGVPLIMIPLPTAAENHQFYNAKAFENQGAGITIEQDKIQIALGSKMLEYSENTENQSKAAKNFAQIGAASKLADIVEEVSI